MAAISRVRTARLIRDASSASSTDAKGAAFEELLTYVFRRVPGITVTARDTVNVLGSEEIDVAFFNERHRLGFYYLPYFILVECKNWSRPVGSEEIAWFDHKLQNRGLTFGVMFASEGITGNRALRTAAHHTVSQALAGGRQIVVVTRNEILALRDTVELNRMIQTKLCDLYASGNI